MVFEQSKSAVQKTAADATLSPSFEPSVYIAEYSDVTDLISAKSCWISKRFVSDFVCCVSSKLKVGFGFIMLYVWKSC